MKLAFVFPGQGTLRVGMGAALLQGFPAARAVFTEASDVVGFDVAGLCRRGPERVLTDTAMAQTCVTVVNLAALAVLGERRIQPQVVAGHSVGSLSALVAAGSLDVAATVALAQRRGQLMGAIDAPGAMVALFGLDEADVVPVCAAARAETGAAVVVALVNAPGAVVVSGTPSAVGHCADLAQAAGAARAVPLAVSHAFHSPLMAPAEEAWRVAVEGVDLRPPRCAVCLDSTGRMTREPELIRQALVAQLTGPVRWMACVTAIATAGCDAVVEVGDSKVLRGMVRSLVPRLPTVSLGDPAVLRQLRRTGDLDLTHRGADALPPVPPGSAAETDGLRVADSGRG